MKLLAQTPEAPIGETWTWQTDVIVATDGTEQRISLCEFPKRDLALTLGAVTEADVRAFTRAALGSGDGLAVPFYQAATRLTGSVAPGAAALSFNAGRTDLRDGCEALIFDRTGRRERVTLAVVSAGGATLATPLAQPWGRSASIAPVWGMVAGGSLGVTRKNPDFAAELKASFTELDFMVPFANEFAPFDLPMFGDYPVLNVNSIGTNFEQQYDTGAETIDYGARVEIRNPWLHAQIMLPRQFLCQRVLQPASWRMWRKLADYTKGSANPFYLPTFREDFERVALGANAVTFEGNEYAVEYAPHSPFQQLAFFLEGGAVHFAAVTNCAIVGGNSAVQFAPALPGGAVVNKVSLLLKVRIADDRISCQHEALETTLSINLRTAD